MEENKTIEDQNIEQPVVEPQKPKKIKKGLIITIIFLILLAVGGLTTWFIISNSNSDSDEKDKAKINSGINVIYFYNDGSEIKYTNDISQINEDSIIAKYECSNKYDYCNIANNGEDFVTVIMDNKKVFIEESKKDVKTGSWSGRIVLFDISTSKVLGTFGYGRWLRKKGQGISDGEYILIRKLNSDSYVIIDKDGNLVHDEFNPGFDKCIGQGCSSIYTNYYSVENDYIVAINKSKKGISKITSNDIVIDYKYDDIWLIDYKYFKVHEDDKWYLYSFETKDKVLVDGFEYIFGVYNDNVVVYNDKKIYIKDLNGNDLIDSPIEGLESSSIDTTMYGPVVSFNDNIISIKVVNWDSENLQPNFLAMYYFNTNTKTLEKSGNNSTVEFDSINEYYDFVNKNCSGTCLIIYDTFDYNDILLDTKEKVKEISYHQNYFAKFGDSNKNINEMSQAGIVSVIIRIIDDKVGNYIPKCFKKDVINNIANDLFNVSDISNLDDSHTPFIVDDYYCSRPSGDGYDPGNYETKLEEAEQDGLYVINIIYEYEASETEPATKIVYTYKYKYVDGLYKLSYYGYEKK